MSPINEFQATRNPRQPGFTLIEVLAAVFLTSMVITFAVSFYIDLANLSQRAIARTRENLQAASALDRIGRDLANTAFWLKAEEDDPFTHPWSFQAESRFSFDGSDTIRFNTRSKSPGEGTFHDSDLLQVVYQVTSEEDGSLTLFRWSSPGLPVAYEGGYPSVDDERSFVVSEGLGSLTLRFLGSGGEWVSSWDSSQLENSEALPIAVEIDISIWNEEDSENWNDEDKKHFTKQVVLYQRPVDLNEMIRKRDEAEANANQAGGGLASNQRRANGESSRDGSDPNNPNANDFFGGAKPPKGSMGDLIQKPGNWELCVAAVGAARCGLMSTSHEPPSTFGIDLSLLRP
ncbi:MAG TPA: prepilin-type N-terminal cleavage/methylation domain-containing protein [Myxococcales bacterium]|nr:prepilin-type N-terminal cleavage/methylation domain-containing protein [Myxococcales bacterium]